jgi:hypothetical protein
MIGNPRRKRRKSRKSHRRSSRRTHSNPGGRAMTAITSPIKEMATMDFAKDAASVAAGFILPNMVVARLPAVMRDSRLKVYGSKALVVAGLSAASSMVSKRAAKMVLLGGGVSILLDLWVDWVAPMVGGASAPAGTGVYYGDDNMGVYYGDGVGSLAESFA